MVFPGVPHLNGMRSLLIFTFFLLGCSNPSEVDVKMKIKDSLYNKAMFNDTYFKYDTLMSSIIPKSTQYITYMYDYQSGVRNIGETISSVQSDSIREYSAFFVDKELFKIYVISYRKSDVGKRADYGESLYYFNGDTVLSKSEYNLNLNLDLCRGHFEHLARDFNGTLNPK